MMVVGEAANGKELFDVLTRTEADLVLLDIRLPDMSGVEIARRLRSDYPHLKILAVSAENAIEVIEAMLEEGIHGFISKQNSNSDELAKAIRTVMNDLEYFGCDISAILYDLYLTKKKTRDITNDFSEREREIILACRDGLLCKEIADRLSVSINTVNYQKRNIYAKLGINNNMEMVRYALKAGIISM
jgi:DNA-binding NarL/FixJ family response regulator